MRKRILIVDDSEMALNFHSYILKMVGFEVDTAQNGMIGLERLLKKAYDVLITDINMPMMDGYELIERVRKNKIDIPIIIVSTEDENRDKVKGMRAGADIYLVKPANPEQLVETVRRLLKC